MKLPLFAAALLCLLPPIARAEDLTTTTGKVYKNARVSTVEPDGITYFVAGGVVKIPFTELPQEVRKQHGYDPKKAAAHAQADEAAQLRLYEQNQRLQASAQQQQNAELERQNQEHGQRVAAQQSAQRLAVLRETLASRGYPMKAHVLSVTEEGTLAFVRTKLSLYEWGEESLDPVFIVGLTGLVDGDRWEGTVYPATSYKYTSALGAAKTVRAVALSPDMAARLTVANGQ